MTTLELATGLAATEFDRLEQAEALVRAFCGWHIAPSRAAQTVTLRANGGRTLVLPSMHVTAVASVTQDNTLLTVVNDYDVSQAGVITNVGYWGYGAVVVVFTSGYPDVPAEVTAIVQAIAQRAVNNTGSLKSKTIGPFSESYSGDGATVGLLEDEKEALRRYSIPAVT